MEKMDLDLVFQVSVCVDNMDKVLSNWRKYFDINEESIIRKSTKEIYDRGEYHCGNYMGKPCEYFHKYYRFDLGGLDFEIIEPITRTAGNPYSDFLAKGGNGIHHLGVKFHDRDRLVKNMEELGIPVMTYAYQGPKTDDIAARSDCYFYDLRKELGVVFEAGGAVVGPLATDPRAGDQAALARLNSYAARPQLPLIEEDSAIEKMHLKQIIYISICVSNLDMVLENWKKYFNIEENSIAYGNAKEEKEGKGDYKYCSFHVGGIDFELIEPLKKDGGDLYSDFLIRNGGNGIHHIGVEFADKDRVPCNMKKLNALPLAAVDHNRLYNLCDMFGLNIETCD